MSFPTFFRIDEESLKIKDYLVAELINNGKVRPILTFYRIDIPLFTVYFPLVQTQEERETTLIQAVWLNSTLKGDGILFGIDSSIGLTDLEGNSYHQDLFLLFFANKMGAFVDPQCYNHNKDDNKIEWVEKQLNEDEIMVSQERIVMFLASQFFFVEHVLPWQPYLNNLKNKGFDFTFHHPFDEKSLQFTQSYLHS